jgi:predicted  nucleic acid-binding Zn-ribbon protein
MRTELEALMRLQTIDGETAQLRGEIAALPKRLAALETRLAAEKTAVEAAVKALKEEEALRRRLESDLKDQQQKIAKLRDQMSSVKTNEEYRAFQHEIEFAEGEIKKVEDQELESMERTEQLEQKRKAQESALKDSTKAVEIEKEDARAASVEQKKHLEVLTRRRAEERGAAADLRSRGGIVAGNGRGVCAGAALRELPHGFASADVESDSRWADYDVRIVRAAAVLRCDAGAAAGAGGREAKAEEEGA